jgi:glycosyltransferase involved in cell wall biosynthesis
MMRILALTNLYPNPFQPQRATFNRHSLRILSQRHAVQVIAPILWTDERNARKAGSVPMPATRRVLMDGITVDHPKYWYVPKAMRTWYGHFFQWSVQSAFRKALTEFKPDIVFSPWAYPDGWAAIQLSRQAGLPVVLKIHGSDVLLVKNHRGRVRGTTQALNQADGVVTVSGHLGERILQLGVNPERMKTIIDGVDLEVFRPGDRGAAQKKLGLTAGTRHLLFIGSLAPVKGIDVLLEACAQLPTHLAPWTLHLIGEGKMRAELAAQAERAGLSDRVIFHGGRAHAELPDWFRSADLFVLASRSEGTPNVLLEAAACGTPFVATTVGGIPAMANLGTARLVPPEDPKRLAEAIAISLLESPSAAPGRPRDRQMAVNELEAFLLHTLERHRSCNNLQLANSGSIQ